MKKDDLLQILAPQIKQSEGFRALPYKDSEDKWTIGYGLLLEQRLPDYVIAQLTDYPKIDYTNPHWDDTDYGDYYQSIFKKQPLKQKTAHYILMTILSNIYDELVKKHAIPVNFPLKKQMCILDIAYNIGVEGLLNFKGFIYELGYGTIKNATGELLISKRAGQVWGRTKHNCEMLLERKLTFYDCIKCTKPLLDDKYSNRSRPREYYAGLVNAFTEQAYGTKLYKDKDIKEFGFICCPDCGIRPEYAPAGVTTCLCGKPFPKETNK